MTAPRPIPAGHYVIHREDGSGVKDARFKSSSTLTLVQVPTA